MDGAKRSALLLEGSLLSAAVALGTNPVAVKYAVAYIPPLPFVALRFALAGLLLLVILRLKEPESKLRRGDILAMAGLGVVGVGVNNVLFTFGVDLTSASDTALIYATPPLWGMLLGFALGQERPTPRGIFGVALALLGVGVVVYGGLGAGETSLFGDLLVSGAAICWGSYTAFSPLLLRKYSPPAVAGYTMFVAGLGVFPFAFSDLVGMEWEAVSIGAWAAMAYSTLIVAAFAFSAWQGGINRIGANTVLVYQYLIVLTGVTSGVVFFGEGLGANKLAGGVIILVGVYLARRQ
jgi:drug/metabolite transporter (DMT)-like permease